jgi:hypothetical protein
MDQNIYVSKIPSTKKGITHIILENVHAPTIQIPDGPLVDKYSHSVHRED